MDLIARLPGTILPVIHRLAREARPESFGTGLSISILAAT